MDHDTALEEQDTAADVLAEVHARALRRFDDVALATQDNREESLTARRFVSIPGAQWDGEWGEQFSNIPKLEIDKVGRGVRKIETDYRENRIIPDFRPDGPKADKESATTLDGLHRADSYRFKSQQARDNAVFEAIAGGFGAYRLTNEYEDESDPDNDHQRINPAAIIADADQSVFFDLNSRLYDKSDARFAFIRTAMQRDAFEDMFGADRATIWPETPQWRVKDWFTPDTIAVAEYYEVEERSEALWILTHSLSGEEKRLWSSELEQGDLAEYERDGWKKRRQTRKRKRVRKYVLSGAEVLEDRGYIVGSRIPIVPVYGRRYFVDGKERWQGYVQSKMDAQRLYNSNVSKLAELNSLAPREVPIFAPEQMPPAIGDLWSRANVERLPYLLAEPLRDENGNMVAQGPMAYVKPPDVPQVTALLLQAANQDLLEEQNDGSEQVRANTSAEAMDIAATRVDAKSGIYLDNVRQSVQCEGEIYAGMASEIYTEAGREVETMSEDGDDGSAILKQPVTDKGGLHRIANDFTTGRYKVIVSVTEATATRRDKTVRAMMQISEAATAIGDPDLSRAALLTAVMNTDGEGSDEFIAYARKKALEIGLVEPNEDELAAMQEAAENQQPDPMAELATAQAQQFKADAAKKEAEVEEIIANTGLKEAQTIKTLADANRPVEPAFPV